MAQLILPNGQTISTDDPNEIAEFQARGAIDQGQVLNNNPGRSLEEIRSTAGQLWNSPGGQGYLDSFLQGHNDPTSPSNPQPFASGTPRPTLGTTVPNPVTPMPTPDPAEATDPLDDYIKSLITGLDQKFTPGFEYNLIPQNSGNDLIESILGGAYNDAMTNVNYQKARGNLNDQGYARATQELAGQRLGGQKTLEEALSGLVTEGRRSLLDVNDSARAAAAGVASPTTPFNADLYFADAQDRAGDFLGGLEGALRNRIDPTALFNTSNAVQRGAQTQGLVNPGALAPERSRYSTVNRGLGSRGGVF